LPRKLDTARLADLDRRFGLSNETNAYVRSAWLELAIANRYASAAASAEAFLTSMGRGLFVRPLFSGLMAQGDWGRPIAERIRAKARASYHPLVAGQVDEIVAGKPAG
jgi:hypothetical protein